MTKLVHEVLLSEEQLNDIKELQKAGYLDETLQITPMGENVLLRLFVFNQYKSELIKRAKEKNKREAEKQIQ